MPTGPDAGLSAGQKPQQAKTWPWLAPSVVFVTAALLTFAAWLLSWGDGGIWAGGLVVGVALPFAFGFLVPVFTPREKSVSSRFLISLGVILAVATVVLREAVVCLIMLAPLWLLAMGLGVALGCIYMGRDRPRPDTLTAGRGPLVGLVVAAFGASLLIDVALPTPESRWRVERTIEIDAAPEQIWPLLLNLTDIGPDEGTANFTQSVLGVPRPQSAIVAGSGVGSVRHGRWGPRVSFEEHVTQWQDGRQLVWDFVFPNDSVQIYTDRRIDPTGPLVVIETGGYHLSALPNGHSRLVLHTEYTSRTRLNAYYAVWGELLIGDIQANILTIIADRAGASQPATASLVSNRTTPLAHTPAMDSQP